LRIISGTARGRKLATPPEKDTSIRPTSDRAREALFSIIGPRIRDSLVLDLFAGTGALGLEAYSRGASQVVLVEKEPTALKIIEKNTSIFAGDQSKTTYIHVIKDDLKRPQFLRKLPTGMIPGFDIIFADPPYDKDFSLPILQYINDNNLLKTGGLIIIEERHNVSLPSKLSSIELIDRRKYGETGFSFYQLSFST
jgi:16S rRNA (guanine966-N2)-methyltransferase